MVVTLNPYLNFRDKTKEAMEFYKSVLGGELTLQTFADFHASEDPAEQNKIMHAQLITADGSTIMSADTPNSMQYNPGNNFSLSLTGDDEPKLRGYFEKLSAGGKVRMPLEKAQWGDTFGMCVDQFGVSWMVNIDGRSQQPAEQPSVPQA